MKTRKDIVQDAKRQRGEIAQFFRDVQHWNHGRPANEWIDPDPDGWLHRTADALDEMIRNEMRPYNFFWAGEKTEIFAARGPWELTSYLKELGAMPDGVEHFNADNVGLAWDWVPCSDMMHAEETGDRKMTYREALHSGPYPPCQIATAYN